MKRILAIVMLLVLVMSVGIISAASADSADNWASARINVSLEENLVCAKYDVAVYLDSELVCVLEPGDMMTFDYLLRNGQHQLKLVPDSLLADGRTWTFSVNQDSYTIDVNLQAHVCSLQYLKCTLSEGPVGITREEIGRLVKRITDATSIIRVVAGI